MAVYDAVNVGMATDAGHGLKVLVIRDADRKPLRTIADEFQSKVLRYMNNTLTLEDVTGATFSITDLSAFDVTLFHPMLPQGQSAILGIGADRDTASGRCFNLILAFDHQLAEGRQAAEALRAIRDRWASYERITCDE
jgi:pyruvate/2-oxoglutarate dehydrogenase complex dihydrolipoamide acyltransferase (E2) component